MIRMSKRALLRERNDAVINYNNLRRGADEVNKVVDAVLAEIVRTYGEITINAPKTSHVKQTVAEKTDDGKLVIRLRSENETKGSDQEGECASPEHG